LALVRFVAAAVVAEHALDGGASSCEPGDRVLERSPRFRRRGLNVGNTGKIIDHGMQVAGSDHRVAPPARGVPVRATVADRFLSFWMATDKAPATPVGDPADLLDVDVDQIIGSPAKSKASPVIYRHVVDH